MWKPSKNRPSPRKTRTLRQNKTFFFARAKFFGRKMGERPAELVSFSTPFFLYAALFTAFVILLIFVLFLFAYFLAIGIFKFTT